VASAIGRAFLRTDHQHLIVAAGFRPQTGPSLTGELAVSNGANASLPAKSHG
jgi:hypothetical protein